MCVSLSLREKVAYYVYRRRWARAGMKNYARTRIANSIFVAWSWRNERLFFRGALRGGKSVLGKAIFYGAFWVCDG